MVKIFLFKKNVSLFQFKEAVLAEAVFITVLYKCPFFHRKGYLVAMTAGNIARPALKGGLAPGT
jgi:hypothetical protein